MAHLGRQRSAMGNESTPPKKSEISKDKTLVIQAMLAEYNSLRTESLGAISNRVTIANFTFGAVAIILAGLINQQNPGVITGVVALIFVPQIAKTGLMVWLGEYNRSQRAGKWISDLEKRINKVVEHDHAMVWESALLGNSIHMSYPYSSVVILLVGAGWSSSFVGFGIFVNIARSSNHQIEYAVGLSIAFIVIVLVETQFIRFFRSKWKKIKIEYSKDGPPIWPI